jgi:ABC-type microcin C transport system permease subunit YejE
MLLLGILVLPHHLCTVVLFTIIVSEFQSNFFQITHLKQLFSLVGLRVELRASHLFRQVLHCLSHTSSPFCSSYF